MRDHLFSSSPHSSAHASVKRRGFLAYPGAVRLAFMSLAFLGMMGSFATQAAGAVVTWSGGGSNDNWSNTSNWVGGAVPPLDAEIVFPADAVLAGPNPTNDVGPYTLNSIRIEGVYTITSTASLTTPTINSTATATIAAPLVVPPGGLITIIQENAIETLTLSKAISGTGGVTVGGPGITQFTGSHANTYTGLTTVQTDAPTGYLRLARAGAESIPADLTIVADGKVIVDAGSSQIHFDSLVTVVGTLDLSLASGLDSGTDNETIGALAGTGLVELGTRRLGCYWAPVSAPTYSGVLVGAAASSFRKHGSFTQILSGTSLDFLGTTVVNGSALTILGEQTSSNITATGGTVLLAGLASVGSVTMSGPSNLSVGNEPGVENQAASKNLSLASSTRLDVFTGSTAGNSQLSVVGSVALNGASLSVNTSVAPPTTGTAIVIILNDGILDAVSGIFASLPEGAELTSSGPTPVTFTISYTGGDGNDVELLSVPASTKPGITSDSTASGTVGTAFTYAIAASNSPTSYQASNLPAGLSVNTTTGVISGTPTTAGTRSVLVSATNASGTGSGAVTMTIDAAPGDTPTPPPGSATSGDGDDESDSGCGAGSTVALIGLLCMLGMTLAGGRRQRL